MTTPVTSDEAAFMATIRSRPLDDAPRLVFADWLDDQGEHARAAFIRRQIHNANHDGGRDFAKVDVRTARTGFGRLLGIKPWEHVREDHVSPMLLYTSSGSYARCVGWHRGFPLIVGCTTGQWEAYGDRFTGPMLYVGFGDYQPCEWGDEHSGNAMSRYYRKGSPHVARFGPRCTQLRMWETLAHYREKRKEAAFRMGQQG